MSKSFLISVVVPVHGKPGRLRLTLASLAALRREEAFELILVADHASPEVKAIAASSWADQILETPGLGRAGARNWGARAAHGELLVFLDDDVLVQPDFLQAHRLAQAQQAGLVHGRIRELIGLLRVDDPREGGPACAPIDLNALERGGWLPGRGTRLVASALEQAAEDPEVFARAPWLASAGANLSIHRAAWEAVGGFDEAYGAHWGLEDLDFGIRVWRSGISISVAPRATALHMSHHSPTRWQEQANNFERFWGAANHSPEALALPALLCANGSLAAYKARLCQSQQVA